MFGVLVAQQMLPKFEIGLTGAYVGPASHWLSIASKFTFADRWYCMLIDQSPFTSPTMGPPETVVSLKMSHSPPPAVAIRVVVSVTSPPSTSDVPPKVVRVEQVESLQPVKLPRIIFSCEPIGTMLAYAGIEIKAAPATAISSDFIAMTP
jgi:hypothetical protein